MWIVTDLVRRCFLAKEGGRLYRQEYQEQQWEEEVWGEKIWEEQVWGENRAYSGKHFSREEELWESEGKELATLKADRVPGCFLPAG